MTSATMTLTERVSKIAGFAAQAAASEGLAKAAQSDALETMHWQAFDGAIDQLLGLMATQEGQAALKELERIVTLAAGAWGKPTIPAHPDDKLGPMAVHRMDQPGDRS